MNDVRFVVETFDYDNSFGICGAIASGEEMVRSAIRVPFWSDLTAEEKLACENAAKEIVAENIAARKNCVFGDRMAEGNEIRITPAELLVRKAA